MDKELYKNLQNCRTRLQAEIKRISTTTLRGDFRFDADKRYWQERLKKLNNELSSAEQMMADMVKRSRK